MTTRRDFSLDDLDKALKDNGILQQNPVETLAMEIEKAILMSATETTVTTTQSSGDANSSVVETTATSTSSRSDTPEIVLEDAENLSTLLEQKPGPTNIEDLENDDDGLFESSESSGNSAEESWSEASSEAMLDEMDDEDQWNDWYNDEDSLEDLDGASEMSQSDPGPDYGNETGIDGHLDKDLDSLASTMSE